MNESPSLATVKAGENAQLAEQINETFRAANQAADDAKASAREAIDKVIQCGQLLISARDQCKANKVGWLYWIEKNLAFSRQYAERYMQLAEVCNRGCTLEEASSLRQAFVLAGILPESHRAPGSQSPSGGSSTWISFFTKGTEHIEKLFQKSPNIRDWPQTTKDIMKEKLRPWMDIYQQL